MARWVPATLDSCWQSNWRAEDPGVSTFQSPLFDGRFSVLSHRIVGEKHLKLTVDADGTEIEGIAFNIDVPQWLATPLKAFHALYRLDVNEYRGERRPQLVIESFWPC